MSSIDEKRVYDARTGSQVAYVATGAGLARVSVSADIVGEFGLAWRGDARDVAVGAGRNGGAILAVAAADGVHVARLGTAHDDADGDGGSDGADGRADGTDGGGDDGPSFRHAGGEDAVAVAVVGGEVATALADGTVLAPDPDGNTRELGGVPDPRAMDGDLVAAGGGVYRQTGEHVGLDDARDVAIDGPLAATGAGLYRLGNGWMVEHEGPVDAVAATGDRAHAATDDALLVRARGPDGYAWHAVEVPVARRIADVAHPPGATFAVAADGTFLADAGDGWRTRSLGLADARALAVRR